MELRIFGAAQEVTGSCHMIRANGASVLLDCGLVQGRRLEAYRRNQSFPFDPESITAVVQSHAHLDHAGKLPMLVREGFRGAIHATHGTGELCQLLLTDCAHVLMRDAEYLNRKRIKQKVRARRKAKQNGLTLPQGLPKEEVLPLYLHEDVGETMALFSTHGYGEWFEVGPGMVFRFREAGHTFGSAWLEAVIQENGKSWRLAYSGDYGRAGLPILRDPEPFGETDILICESTYGNTVHPEFQGMVHDLAEAVQRLVQRGHGRLLIPSFAVGRTQNVLYCLGRVFDEALAPQVPVVVDSPLATAATKLITQYPEYFDQETLELLANGNGGPFFPGLRFTESVEESKALNQEEGPLVIVSASGMMENGRILHHLARYVSRRDAEILVVGFQADGTLGRRLLEGAATVNILGDSYKVNARITPMMGFSSHADRRDLLQVLNPLAKKTGTMILVHGEDEQRKPLAKALRDLGFPRVEEPVEKQAFRFS
ncbi:MAG: MBL fold metallo-hydrolase [Planctomycetota bacterium]|nr:MAG: MBL fold metallo-hydrolase [Planctomycetota bacterium]